MTKQFLDAFGATFIGVAEIAVIVAIAWVMVARGIIHAATIKGLSDVTVLVFLPCLMFSNILETLKPAEQPLWWVIPLIGIAMFFGTTLIATLAFANNLREKRDLIPLSAMQNAAFVVLPIGQVLLAPKEFDRFALYTFLFLVFYSPLFWSVGKALTTGGSSRFTWWSLVTPPAVANLLALAFVLTGTQQLVPDTVESSIKLLGSATIPVATFVLGGSLGGLTHRFRHHLRDAIRSLSVKFIVIPLVTVLVLSSTSIRRTDPTLALMLVLQGSSAPATNIVLQITTYGGNMDRTGTIIMLGYIVAIVAMPFWVAVWQVM
ncbi:MAG: AEC family transporter [Gemmatimonadetes bacterium]|nr:AEC family transporter [Gemmatimonadota bacterium]